MYILWIYYRSHFYYKSFINNVYLFFLIILKIKRQFEILKEDDILWKTYFSINFEWILILIKKLKLINYNFDFKIINI